jgi:hypothetical protein
VLPAFFIVATSTDRLAAAARWRMCARGHGECSVSRWTDAPALFPACGQPGR